MRNATKMTVLAGLLLVLALALGACGGDDESGSGSEALASERAPSGERAPAPEAASPAGEKAAASSEAATPSGSLPVELAQGEEIDITQHLDAGKITIVDFYSEYCGPCKRLEPYMLKLHQERDDITVIKVDINRPGVRGIDWGSPVARQYRLQSIPHFQIYDPQGRLLAEGPAAIPLLQGYMEGKS